VAAVRALVVRLRAGPCLADASLRTRGNHLAKPINRWFVSVRPVGALWHARQTKGFPTETEAKQYAKSMLFEGNNVIAGTMNPHQPRRRAIDASEIDEWLEEKN
jgi:hypothetical protein